VMAISAHPAWWRKTAGWVMAKACDKLSPSVCSCAHRPYLHRVLPGLSIWRFLFPLRQGFPYHWMQLHLLHGRRITNSFLWHVRQCQT
jgi:hypothetical protein